MTFSREELLICAIARMLEGCRNIAVGAVSPIPGSAALLVQALSNGRSRASILGSNVHNPFNDGGPELFDRAGQGRVDAFFLGGGQIDGDGYINLVSSGPYPEPDTRFPGSFGSAYLYFTVPRVILFREEHSRRVLVNRVDFISAPGWSPPGVHRPGGLAHAPLNRVQTVATVGDMSHSKVFGGWKYIFHPDRNQPPQRNLK